MLLAVVVVAVASRASPPVVAETAIREAPSTLEPDRQVMPTLRRLPLHFEENLGQTDPSVTHLVRAGGYIAYFTPQETVFALRSGGGDPDALEGRDEPWTIDVVRMRLHGGRAEQEIVARDPQEGRSNYFIGDDPDQWRTGVRHFGSLESRSVYPGIDLHWRSGESSRLTYDFIVAPGADPSAISMGFDGAESVVIDDDGSLIVTTPNGELRHTAPVLFQTVDHGRRVVAGVFERRTGRGVGFRVGAYDRRRPLVIDPGLSYSSYYGGAGSDAGYECDVNSSGAFYFCGYTASTDFPTASPYRSTNAGYRDAFVAKLTSSGGSLLYATYLGGARNDYAYGMDIGPNGRIHLGGQSFSTDFPMASAYQSTGDLGGDGIVVRLSSSGSALDFSTYFGGSGADWLVGIEVDSSGAPYVNGYTQSSDLPMQSAIQGTFGGGTWDGFVTKFAANGGSLSYSTYVGGSGDETGYGRLRLLAGAVYIAGWTTSSDYPTTIGALGTSFNGGAADVTVTKVNAAGSAWAYSTFVGGGGDDRAIRLDVDSSGNAYVVGHTTSTDFATTISAFQSSHAGGTLDGFVFKLNASGTSLVYSTYVGGSGAEWAGGGSNVHGDIMVDASGNAYVAGQTSSTDFPVVSAFQPTLGGGEDAFVLRLNSSGGSLDYSSYLGGAGDDWAYQVHANADGSAWVVGFTSSTDFPTQSPLFSSVSGAEDAFVTKVAAPTVPATPLNIAATAPDDESVILTWLDVADYETGYELERATGADPFVRIAELEASVDDYTDEDVSGDTGYVYRVRAVNPMGASGYSTSDSLFTPPSAPSDVLAVPVSDTRIDLSWNDNSDSEMRYRIERRAVPDPEFQSTATLGQNSTSHTDAAARPETRHVYRIRAENSVGASVWIESVSVMSAPATPRPRDPRAASDTSVVIEWQDVSDEETGYELQRGNGCPGTAFATLQILPAGATSFTDETARPEVTYAYRVRALGDGVPSNWSDEMCVTMPPFAPADVIAEALSPSRIRLAWTDRSSAEDDFVIRRKELPDGPFIDLAVVDADVTEFLDTAVGADTAYVYGVRAEDENGRSSEVVCEEARTPSGLLIAKAKIKYPKAKKSGKPKPALLTLTGEIDIGDRGLSLSAATTLRVGDAVFDVSRFGNQGKGYRYENGEVRIDLKPVKGSAGRVRLKLRMQGDRVLDIDPDRDLVVSYANGDLRAVGVVRLREGRFEPARGFGWNVDPKFTLSALSAALASGPKDVLKIKGSFDASAGLPSDAHEVTIALGSFRFRAPAKQFTEKKGKLLFKQKVFGTRKIILDYRKGSFTATLKGVELGEFTRGNHAVIVEIVFGDVLYRSTLQMTSSGKELRY